MSFAMKLKRKANMTNDYEESEDSEESDESPETKRRGELIVLNVDLGKKGFVILNGFSKQSAQEIANEFCRKHKLGP